MNIKLPDVSPCSWYVAGFLYLIQDQTKKIQAKKYNAHENWILISAKSPKDAKRKAIQIAKTECAKHRDDTNPLGYKFMGLTEFMPVHEPPGDGSEIFWIKHSNMTLAKAERMTG